MFCDVVACVLTWIRSNKVFLWEIGHTIRGVVMIIILLALLGVCYAVDLYMGKFPKSLQSCVYGELNYNWYLNIYGCLFTYMAVSSGYVFYNTENASAFLNLIVLMFGVFAVWSFVEMFKVKGTFDEQSISFYTPWSGSKDEQWEDLLSIDFSYGWKSYVFTFKSGNKIRLSEYLSGHGEVLNLVAEKFNKRPDMIDRDIE